MTHRTAGQRWAETPLLDVPEFELHLATWVEQQRVLFVCTESAPALDELLEHFGVAHATRHLAPDDLVRLVTAADPGSYFSVGLRAAHARRAQGASYDMTAGPAVQTALDYTHRTSTILGHVMARPQSGNRGTVGFSVAKSKLWEPDNAQSLLDFRRWAEERAAELDRASALGQLPGLDVQLGEQFDGFPDAVLGAALDAGFLTGEHAVLVRHVPVTPGDLDILVRRDDDETLELTLTADDTPVWRGQQSAAGRVIERENDGAQALAAATGEIVELARALRDAPIAVFFADGSMIVGDIRLPPRASPGDIPADRLLADAWDGITITDELSAHGSVQSRTAELAAYGAASAATDHGSGELADFISLAVDADTAHLRLFHCKGAGGPAPGRRVSDLYEVLGQVVKSVPWTLAPAVLWRELLRRLDERDAFRLLHGDADPLREQLERFTRSAPRELKIEIIAVQPGVSISDVPHWPIGRALLHAADGWCTSESVSFRLFGSQ